MSDPDEVLFPPDQRSPDWYEDSPVEVRWDARREHNLSVVTAIGTIMVARELPPGGDEADENAYLAVAGRISIAKPFLCEADASMDMDALTSDHDHLASAVLGDEDGYDEAFSQWFEDEFGLVGIGDPVFVLDMKILEEHRDPDALVAAHAALDALATFGSATSPLITFDIDGLDTPVPPGQRNEASWTWVHALRAKRWKHVYVMARP